MTSRESERETLKAEKLTVKAKSGGSRVACAECMAMQDKTFQPTHLIWRILVCQQDPTGVHYNMFPL